MPARALTMRLQNKDAEDGITETQTAPGAGRKPQGVSRKAAKLTMRIMPTTRSDLERAAKKRGVSLNKDVFTGEALRRGIDVLVSHFAPRGTPVTPISVEEAAAEMVGDAAEAYRSPIGLGETEAGQVMTWIEISNFRDLQEIESAHAGLRKDVPGVWFPKKKWLLHKQIFDELSPGGKHAWER
jgi:hypothetical protein